MTWTIDQLKAGLNSSKDIKGWAIHEEHVHRRERYFMMDASALVADQDRDVHSQNVELTLYVHLAGKPGRQGEITKKLFKALPLGPQIEGAVAAAQQTDHQAWELPTELPSKLPQLASADPRLGEDLERVMGELSGKIEKAVGKKRGTVFNSAELFLSNHDRTLHLSNGLTHRYSQSRIYSEAAFSYSKKAAEGVVSDEYLNSRWAVSLDEFDIEKLFDETSERAQASLDVRKPQTGKFPVIVDSEVLALLFNDHLTHLTARNSYLGLPFSTPGSELIEGATGDLLDIRLDPHLDFGADTVSISSQGVLQKPIQLVERNKVIATSADKQHADYLKLPVTTVRGSVVVGPGKLSYDELKKQAPQVVEILQFSALFADPNSGTFSSEIRLAKLYDNEKGTVSYLKGGSVSGSIGENFKGARFSKSCTQRAHFTSNSLAGNGYYGPEYALLSDVSIVG